jgi:hypothetical protein
MSAREVELQDFCNRLRLNDETRRRVHKALSQGMGVANYGNTIITFGSRDADIFGLPPREYGGSELADFVAPAPVPASKRSPLLDAVGGPPQVSRPRVAPSQTEYPEVLFAARSSPQPRGKKGYIDQRRFASRREPEEVTEEVPVSEEAAWWRDRL